MTTKASEFPRRCQIDLMVPAELAIRDAMLAVEAMGADTRLTDALVLLSRGREKVADFVDGKSDKDRPIHEVWRVGSKVPINVYEGDRPVCQCHASFDARRIVQAVNAHSGAQP